MLKRLSVYVNRLLISGMGLISSLSLAADTLPGSASLSPVPPGNDAGLSFDSDFLNMGEGADEQHVDLNYFAHKGGLPPGAYVVQVTVNGRLTDSGRLVTFRSWPEQPGKLYACVNARELAEWWGILASLRAPDEHRQAPASLRTAQQAKTEAEPGEEAIFQKTDVRGATTVGEGYAGEQAQLSDETRLQDAQAECPIGGLTALVPYAQEVFDLNHRTLALTVPQASLGPASRLRTPPQLWDEGASAILMNYTYSGNQQSSEGGRRGSDFLGLASQLNLQAWRIRNDLNWHQEQGGAQELNASGVYAQRDFSMLGGGLITLGRTTSASNGIDSVLFTGVRLESDDGMLDPGYTRYTPAITGIAQSPATITVRQYGQVIYQQNVPQGPYSLTEFNRSGNGEVDVEVRESDGQTRHFTLAQAASNSILSQGHAAWSVSGGQAARGSGYADDRFVQGVVSYGAWANTTLTGGSLISADYQSLSLGSGFYAGAWGAFSYTLRASRADLSAFPESGEGVKTGISHALSWSRSFGDTAAGISWIHSQTRDFYNFNDLHSMKAGKPRDGETGSSGEQPGRQHDSYSLSLSQPVGIWGSVSLSGTRTTFRDSSAVQSSVSLSYNATVKDIGIGMALGYSQYADDESTSGSDNTTDKTVSLTLSLPLGKWSGVNSMNGSYSMTRVNGQSSRQAGINGSAMDGALSWAASRSLSGSHSGSTSVSWSGNYGSASAGYSYGAGSRSLSYGGSGGLAFHAGGVTAGRQLALSGASALVEIPGVRGVNVNGATTDWRGFALVSGLTPYDQNQVNVDMADLAGNVELDTSSRNVVPTRGALVVVPFRSSKGYRLMITLTREQAEVPFGATASLLQKDDGAMPVTGIVGDDGLVYMSGMPAKGEIRVTWGEGPGNQCSSDYQVPDGADVTVLMMLRVPCQ